MSLWSAHHFGFGGGLWNWFFIAFVGYPLLIAICLCIAQIQRLREREGLLTPSWSVEYDKQGIIPPISESF